MSRRHALIAVSLPLLAIALGIVRAELFLGRARDFVFEIDGYDPRDLLRGHYLQFRLRMEPLPVREPCEDDASRLCCVCLSRGEAGAVSRAERATCATARVRCDAAMPLPALWAAHRYYVPEDRAAALARRLQEAMPRRAAQAVVAIDAGGEVGVRELRIDGEPIPGAVAR